MIPTAAFGRTGHDSTRVIFGAAGLATMSQPRADEVLATLLARGVNHIDTAAGYGESELRIGPWMAEHRDRFFLATKTGERTGAGARAQLEASLTRLRVERVDLVQLHNLVEPDEWAQAHRPGGALEALVQARQEGLVRFIGVTGHGLRIAAMHRRSLEQFPYDSVLLPYSWVAVQDDAYRADVEALLAVCAERGVAVQTIKAVARRRWSPDHDGARHSWYEPLPGGEVLARAVRWVLGHPQVFVDTSSDVRLLGPILDAAGSAGNRPGDDEMRADAEALGIENLFDGDRRERI